MRIEKTQQHKPQGGKIVLFAQVPKTTVAEAISEALKGIAKAVTKVIAVFKDGPISNYIRGIIERAAERQEVKNRLRALGIDPEQTYCMKVPSNSEIKILFPTNERERDKPPYVEVTETLTRQRTAGRRKKRNYHTRNRRKRKWQ